MLRFFSGGKNYIRLEITGNQISLATPLSEELAMGLTRNLEILPPSGWIELDNFASFLPGNLANYVTSEMWSNGFVKESERFLVNVMHSIKSEVMVSEGIYRMRGPGSLTMSSRTTAMMP